MTAAVSRLPTMKDRLMQLELAGLLAREGNYAGWDAIVSGIVDNTFTGLALEKVHLFEGMKDETGSPLNLADELDKLLPQVPEANRQSVQSKIDQLKARGR